MPLNLLDQKIDIMAVIVCHLLISAIVELPYNRWRKRMHDALTES